MENEPAAVPGETLDWTFVVDDGCAQCGYVPHDVEETAARVDAAAGRWTTVLARASARNRPAPPVWSPVEYGAHVRDMLRLLGERVELMVTQENPRFGNWDQDQVAVERGYYWADPAETAADLARQADGAVLACSRIGGALWERTGQRSDGVGFTVASLSRFVVHDVEHHLHDVDG